MSFEPREFLRHILAESDYLHSALRDISRESFEQSTAHAMRVEELQARGLSRDEAEAEARRRFGDIEEFQVYAA